MININSIFLEIHNSTKFCLYIHNLCVKRQFDFETLEAEGSKKVPRVQKIKKVLQIQTF